MARQADVGLLTITLPPGATPGSLSRMGSLRRQPRLPATNVRLQRCPETGVKHVPRHHTVPPAGFEPAHPPPEGGALSPELRGARPFTVAVPRSPRTGRRERV